MKYSFRELVDLAKLQELTDYLYDASSIPSSIITMDGEVLTGSGWQRICLDFHRRNPECERDCIASDTAIREEVKAGKPYAMYKCPRGLVDASAPIIIDGQHVANAFSGQVLLEPPTEETEREFREQARKFGFDAEEYIKAFHEIPIVTKKQFIAGISYLAGLANLVADIGLIRKRELEALKEVRESEQKYRSLLNSIDAGVVVHAADTSILLANPSACKLLGLSEDQIMGKTAMDPYWKFVREDGSDMPLNEYPVYRVKAEGKPLYNFVLGVVSSSKKDVTWLLVNGFPELTKSGQVEKTVINFVDITKSKNAELALIDSEKRYKALHNASFGGIAIHDKGVILECNNGLSEITGFLYEELIGMDGLQLISDDTRDLVVKNIKEGYEKPYEAVGVKKNGEHYPLRLEARGIPYQGKDVRVVEFRDISEVKAAEKEKEELQSQLRQAQKMEAVGRLAGGVAHDFNNMLSLIIGHSDMALGKIDKSNPLYADLIEIKKAGDRSADLTRQLLAFARKQTVEPREINLNKTVDSMIKMLKRLIGEEINLSWQPADNLWSVKMDPSQLDQILANLSVNARDAISGIGEVTIETRNITLDDEFVCNLENIEAGDYVLLRVSDTGSGMDLETLENLFEPFFTTKAPGKGTGLGLATVYGIVKQNKGLIEVDSKPGKGSVFDIYLPRHVPVESQPSLRLKSASPRQGHETILLVEDEPGILRMTKIMLQRFGYNVLAATTPRKAIEIAEEYKEGIDLLITDVIMPQMNGRELVDRIRSVYPGIKYAFMSGYSANVLAPHGILNEGLNFIQKPFTLDDLGSKVQQVLKNTPSDPV